MSRELEQQKADILELLHLKRQHLNGVAQGLAVKRAALEAESDRLTGIFSFASESLDIAAMACGEAARQKYGELRPQMKTISHRHRDLLEQVLKLDIAAKNLK